MSARSRCGRAWPGATKEPYYIRRLLTEGAAQASDKRAVFVGAEAYEAAGGVIARDLFQHDGGGWFEDVARLDRLARERLEAVAAEVRSEGWKWRSTSPTATPPACAGSPRRPRP